MCERACIALYSFSLECCLLKPFAKIHRQHFVAFAGDGVVDCCTIARIDSGAVYRAPHARTDINVDVSSSSRTVDRTTVASTAAILSANACLLRATWI